MLLDVDPKLRSSIEYAVKFCSEAEKMQSGRDSVLLSNALEVLLHFSDKIKKEAAKPPMPPPVIKKPKKKQQPKPKKAEAETAEVVDGDNT